jgi:imidazolonepropionase-like amidohydrolase
MSASLLIKNVRPMGAASADILIEHGRIARIAPGITADGVPVEEGGGRIAIPGLVEAHTHLDKSLLGMNWYRNEVGPKLLDKISASSRRASRGARHCSPSPSAQPISARMSTSTPCTVSPASRA